MSKSKFLTIVTGIIVIAFVLFMAVQVFSSKFEKFKIEEAVTLTVSDSIETTGFIIRDETCIKNRSSGAISYDKTDGSAVGKGGTVANIFASESQAADYRKTNEIKQNIESLRLINGETGSVAADLDTVNNAIESKIVSLLSKLNEKEYLDLDEIKHSMTSSINQRQHIVGEESGYDEQISQLEAQLNEISASPIDTVLAPISGYFSSKCDGYESAVSYKDVLNLTLEELENIKPGAVEDDCIGKVANSFKWYIAAKVDYEEALKLSMSDSSVTVSMPFVENGEIDAVVEAVNQTDRSSDGVVILSCERMNERLINARKEPISINLKTYTGLRVPKKAIHDNVVTVENEGKTQQKTVQGVYVLTGQEIDFKEISIVYSDDDIVLCDPSPDYSKLATGSTIKMYDQIITEGADIYDGKVVE